MAAVAANAAAAAAAVPIAENAERVREAARLFRVHKTVTQMCKARGYMLGRNNQGNDNNANANDWLLNNDLEDFKAKIVDGNSPLRRNQLNFVCSKPGSEPRQTLLVWYEAGDFRGDNKDFFKKLLEHAETYGAQHCIVVSVNKVPSLVKNWIEASNREIQNTNAAHIQVFPEDHLVVNITDHELVPKHEPLTPDETQQMLKAFALNAAQLPRLLATDPVALYFGLQRGAVVKITRKSETAGTYVTFRQVI